jgi:hypothetical protein
MMDNRRDCIAAYLQPAFLICTAVLALAGVGMSLATQRLGLYLKKEPLPLKRPLNAMDEGKLAPYQVTAKIPIEDRDVLKSLGTEDYIQWLLEDPREPAPSPVRKLLLFVTYYRQPDRVPHVPEECYTGGGYQRLATNAVALRIGPAGSPREIPGRYLLFGRRVDDVSRAVPQFPVLYLFRVNGEYAGSRDDARMVLNRNIFSKYSYFCKIELVFNQSSAAPTREMAVAASEKLLTVLLPLLEQEHWPDSESGVLQNGHSAYFGREKSASRFSPPRPLMCHSERVRPILQGNRGTDFLEEYRSNVHFAELQLE